VVLNRWRQKATLRSFVNIVVRPENETI
jgi:hypothetical protein